MIRAENTNLKIHHYSRFDRRGRYIVTSSRNSIFLYNSDIKFKPNENKYKYIAAYIQLLEKLFKDGYDTIYYVQYGINDITESLLIQSLETAKRHNIRLKIIGYCYSEPYSINCKDYFYHYCDFSNTPTAELYKAVLSNSAIVVGLINTSDRVYKRAYTSKKSIFNLKDISHKEFTDYEFSTTLSICLYRKLPLTQAEETLIRNRVSSFELNQNNEIEYWFSDSEDIQFIIEIPYNFKVGEYFNKSFYLWADCFINISDHLGYGRWKYYLGNTEVKQNSDSSWCLKSPTNCFVYL